MRIIAGSGKGRRLKTLRGMETRPTADKVKGAIFNIVGTRVNDAKLLDLFAGTGSLSLEGLSRGAATALVVEQNRKACAVIEENARLLGVQDRITICNMDVFQFLQQEQPEKYDLIFVDPPYRQGLADRVLCLVKNRFILNPGGVMIIEAAAEEDLPDELGLLEVRITKRYGDTKLWFLQHRERQEV